MDHSADADADLTAVARAVVAKRLTAALPRCRLSPRSWVLVNGESTSQAQLGMRVKNAVAPLISD